MSMNKINLYSFFIFLLSSNLLFISAIFTSRFLLHSFSPTLDLHFISPAKQGNNLKMVLHLRFVLWKGGKDCTVSIRKGTHHYQIIFLFISTIAFFLNGALVIFAYFFIILFCLVHYSIFSIPESCF